MRTFDEILAIAAGRHGGAAAVLAKAAVPKTAEEIAAIPDHEWLEAMAKSIFQAGISWAVVEAKWPGLREAFGGFAVAPLAMMDDARFDALVTDPRVIRSGAKIAAIRDNAAFIQRVSAEAGGFGRRIADWPASDFAGLLTWLGREGSRLGGNTGAYVLRSMGKEGFLLSRDVLARLTEEGVIAGAATSPRALKAVQAAFDRWQAESGLTLNQISRTLSQSIGPSA
jgi:3-methyladenine DNA glycosylase Tag